MAYKWYVTDILAELLSSSQPGLRNLPAIEKSQGMKSNSSKKNCLVYSYTNPSEVQGERRTLFTIFSGVFTTRSGCFPFLEGVRLIFGEWNLSINFMVNEVRWERWESKEQMSKTNKNEKISQPYAPFYGPLFIFLGCALFSAPSETSPALQ